MKHLEQNSLIMTSTVKGYGEKNSCQVMFKNRPPILKNMFCILSKDTEINHCQICNIADLEGPKMVFLSSMFDTHLRFIFTLTFPVPCISESCIEIKIKLNFYFRFSLWSLKRFYEGL